MLDRYMIDSVVVKQDNGNIALIKYILFRQSDTEEYSIVSEKHLIVDGLANFEESARSDKSYSLEKAFKIGGIFLKGEVFPSTMNEVEKDILLGQ